MLALIGASIRLSFRGGVCRWRVAEDGRRGWPAVIRSDTRISLIYCARRCVFSPQLPISPSLSLSLPVFHFFSLALVYEVGSELWQLAAIEKILRESLPRSKARSNLGASVLDVRTTRIGRLIGRSFSSFFFFFFLFKKLSNSFSSPPLNTVQFVTFGVCAKFK